MFGKFFKKKGTTDAARSVPPDTDPVADALFRAIAEQKKEDPLVGLKIGGKEVLAHLMGAMKSERGVHIESLLSILGSLAGFSCQMSIRAELQGTPEAATAKPFVVLGGANGKKYFFGDALNRPLAESQYSIWGLTGGAAQHLGCKDLPDLNEVFKHVAGTVGTEGFGIPRIPENHRPSDLPINYVKAVWPKLLPIASRFCDKPSEWPILFGLAIQEAMYQSKGVIDPKLAMSIVMESAIPMSKIDPAEVGCLEAQ